MSNKDTARRTVIEVYLAGVNISEAIRRYLISLSYTDNEEDEADDLQIKMEDRDGIWLEQWLDTTVQSAASSFGADTASLSARYEVTAKAGLNVRSGPGTSHGKLGALSYGTVISVSEISGGWASIQYSGKDAYVSEAYIKPTEAEAASAPENKGLRVQAAIVRENWHSDGKDKVLDCGEFELDTVTASGPPSEVTLKCTALPYSARIRQTEKSKAWEGYNLSGIAKEIAWSNGMACLYESALNPDYARQEQISESDISFLSRLCHNAGISLKATNNIIVLFDQAAYENMEAITTITRADKSKYLNYKLSTGSADTQYASCRVSYTDPDTGAAIGATAYVEDYEEIKKRQENREKRGNESEKDELQQLEVYAKVNSVGEAQLLAEKSLRMKNKYEYSASFTLPGDPGLVAGVTVTIAGFGPWSGKYIIKQAKHTVGSSGYTTQITLRRVLEGY